MRARVVYPGPTRGQSASGMTTEDGMDEHLKP